MAQRDAGVSPGCAGAAWEPAAAACAGSANARCKRRSCTSGCCFCPRPPPPVAWPVSKKTRTAGCQFGKARLISSCYVEAKQSMSSRNTVFINASERPRVGPQCSSSWLAPPHSGAGCCWGEAVQLGRAHALGFKSCGVLHPGEGQAAQRHKCCAKVHWRGNPCSRIIGVVAWFVFRLSSSGGHLLTTSSLTHWMAHRLFIL